MQDMRTFSNGEDQPTVIDVARARKSLPNSAVRRQIRQHAGVSQWDLGRWLGVTGACVSLWERENGGREPRGVRLVRYVDLLKELADIGGAG